MVLVNVLAKFNVRWEGMVVAVVDLRLPLVRAA